ncbi:hypothetical protein ACIRPH_21015 [Nocardiopsis sp. NPDC101807]|uniref:hypothetical protein n=1 Tax=Nocardiopsis sp. NPDC101807 TaxID=3364339 RepID=UPI00382C9F0B
MTAHLPGTRTPGTSGPADGTAARPGHRVALAVRLDAATCAGAGLLLTAGAALLAAPLGLPVPLLLGSGLFLLVFAALLWFGAATTPIVPSRVHAVIAVNAAWVAGSAAVVALAGPTAVGVAFVLAQAAAVAGITVAEAVLLRRDAKGDA